MQSVLDPSEEKHILVVDDDSEVRADEPGVWRNGTVYDPTSGRTYSAEARLDGSDRLRLRGYLGIRLLGRTTTWIRVDAEPRCELR